jgi:GNAT superfamily N-acetyltransferase
MTTAFSETIETRRLTTATEIAECQRLRYEVWCAEGVELTKPEAGMIADSHDEHAMHWGVFDGTRLVGAARLCLHETLADAPDCDLFVGLEIPAPIASINRLVALKSHRGRGIGNQLDQRRIQEARALGARTIIGTCVNAKSRRHALAAQGFLFTSARAGHPIWSPSVEICPCYLRLESKEDAPR